MLERDVSPAWVDRSTWLGALLWRVAAGVCFACALLFIRHGLLGAALLLMAAVLCLPAMRAALRHATGLRMAGASSVAVVTVLVCCGVVSAGRSAEARWNRGLAAALAARPALAPGPALAPVSGAVVVSSTQPP